MAEFRHVFRERVAFPIKYISTKNIQFFKIIRKIIRSNNAVNLECQYIWMSRFLFRHFANIYAFKLKFSELDPGNIISVLKLFFNAISLC